MNKSEVLEIKRQLKEEKTTITKICGCYVDSEKNIITSFSDTFLTLPDEEMLKYLELFKKTLSGTLGKNLLNMDFPLENSSIKDEHNNLIELKESELKDDGLTNKFYESVISSYDYSGNFLILLVYGAYDIPAYGSDNIDFDSDSDYVFNHIICAICPVELSQPALSYIPNENTIRNRNRDWVVGQPMNGFLFPAYNDGSSDINSILYFSKNPALLNEPFINNVLGCESPLNANDQKITFSSIIEESLGENCDYETINAIQEDINLLFEESKEDLRSPIMEKDELKNLLIDNDIKEKNADKINKVFEDADFLDTGLHLANLANTSKFEVKMDNISLKVPADLTNLVETKIIDGRKSIVITVTDQVEINGIMVNINNDEK